MGALAVVISKETAGVMVAFLGAVGALYGTRNTWWNSRASEDRATRDELRQALERESTLRQIARRIFGKSRNSSNRSVAHLRTSHVGWRCEHGASG